MERIFALLLPRARAGSVSRIDPRKRQKPGNPIRQTALLSGGESFRETGKRRQWPADDNTPAGDARPLSSGAGERPPAIDHGALGDHVKPTRERAVPAGAV